MDDQKKLLLVFSLSSDPVLSKPDLLFKFCSHRNLKHSSKSVGFFLTAW
jgi:hypothetical protein